MPKFREKPVTIEAVQWNGRNVGEVAALIDFAAMPDDGSCTPGIGLTVPTSELHVPSIGGMMTAKPGDWIIKGKGELHACDPKTFATFYEPA